VRPELWLIRRIIASSPKFHLKRPSVPFALSNDMYRRTGYGFIVRAVAVGMAQLVDKFG
jgi:hypothetical protein